MTRLADWKCDGCGHVWEFLSHGEEDHPDSCPSCGSSTNLNSILSGSSITKCHDPEVKKEILKKRSADHTRKLVAKQAGHRGTLPPNFGRTKQH